MTADTAPVNSAVRPETVPLQADSTLRVETLTITPHADGFVVGRTDTGRFVVLPDIGVRALRHLQDGLSVRETSRLVTADDADEPVDVLDFATSLIALGFASAQGLPPAAAPEARRGRGVAWAPQPRFTWLFTRPVAVLASLCAAAAAVLMVAVPSVRPQAYDVFFLSTPARSLAAVTLITYGLALVHELAHVYGAAAVGVPARLRVTRRLYFLTFETNLTGLWGLPPRRRVGPLLAGMGFDAVVLVVVLSLRTAQLGPDRLLAAVALVELFAIVTQFFVFLRTDVYAVMTALLGCTNLAATTRLELRRMVGLLSPGQRTELAACRPRDVAVARWYRWVHLAGMAFAAWFFVLFFLPSTWHLLEWMWQSLSAARPAESAFWEALALGVLVLSPRVLTLAVFVRERLGRRRTANGADS